nr:O-antigen ligase family protein [uncultured Psychroserpens sp.]
MKFSNYLWALYLIAFPFYILPEGNPQLADVFGVLAIAFNIKPILLHIKENSFSRHLFLFVCYTFIVNVVFLVIVHTYASLITSINYLYCYLLLLFVLSKFKDPVFLKFTVVALTISLILQLGISPFVPSQGVRSRLLFNNPNQLAFWALASMLIINILSSILKTIKFAHILTVTIICSFFIIISASRSATAGALLFWIFFYLKSKKNILIFTIVIVGLLSFSYFNGNVSLEKFSQITYIFDRISESDNTTSSDNIGRGYDRLFDYPQYLFFGSGEGSNERFNSTIELHSTFVNILFSYGIVGFILFFMSIASIFKKISIQVMVLLLILGVYATVHMTLRLPLFWITLLLIVLFHKYKTGDFELESIKKSSIKY